MISALDKKLVRDLWGMKGQALAITLVIACGIATFVMSLTNLDSLEHTRAEYYDRYGFAELFAHVKRAPLSLAHRISEIPGIKQSQTRIVVDVTLDVEKLNEPAVGRLISVPEHGDPILNRLFLRSGRWIHPGRRGEVLANEAFMQAHGYKPGVKIKAVLNGSKEELTVVGVVLSPEYIFSVRPGDILPDDKRFGIFWMGERQLAAAFDMEGAFNDITMTMMPGTNEDEVIRQVDYVLAPYGGAGSYGRSEQISHRLLSDDLDQLKGTGFIAPIVFLGVAAFLLNVVLGRLVSTQREQIAALKAFGYTHWEVGFHYLKLVLLVIVLGVGVGTLLGRELGKGLAEMYTVFYKFPSLEYRFNFRVVFLALFLSCLAGVLGTLGSVRSAVNLPPAEAMRPEPPASYQKTILERLGFQAFFSVPMRMIIRNLERRPLRAMISILGIALAVSILVMGFFSEDAMNYMMTFQFSEAQRQDVSVSFVEPTTARAIHELEHAPGVLSCEPYRAVSARLRFGHRSRRSGILGLTSKQQLNRVLNEDHRVIPLPEEGLVLSKKLAELLQVNPGDELTVEVLEGERPTRKILVSAIVSDYAGTNAYAHLDAVRRLLREGHSYTGAYLQVDSRYTEKLYRQLKNTPRIAGVGVQSVAIQSFKDVVAESMNKVRSFNIIFAIIIAAGVVYNTARISLSERSRELATLRVMGFTRGEISSILLGELAVLTLVAVPLGLGLGYLFAWLVTWAVETDLFRFPLVIYPRTYGIAASVVLGASIISGLIVRRKLDHLDLVSVLKSKE